MAVARDLLHKHPHHEPCAEAPRPRPLPLPLPLPRPPPDVAASPPSAAFPVLGAGPEPSAAPCPSATRASIFGGASRWRIVGGAPPRRDPRSRSRFSSLGFGAGAGAGASAATVDVDAPPSFSFSFSLSFSLSFSRSRRDLRSTPAPLSAASNWREASPSTGRERREGAGAASPGADEEVAVVDAVAAGTPAGGALELEDAAGAALDAAAAPLRSRGGFGAFAAPCFDPDPFASLLAPPCAWPCCCAATFPPPGPFFAPFLLLGPAPDSPAFSFSLSLSLAPPPPAPSFFLSPFFVDAAAAASAAGSL